MIRILKQTLLFSVVLLIIGVSATGIVEAATSTTTWYFAEGSTDGYDTWLSVLNPSTSSAADLTITYMDTDSNTVQVSPTVNAQTRYTANVNVVSGMENKEGVSTTVESTNGVGIVAERIVYWDSGGITDVGGHCTIGAIAPATTWYFAEGSTNGYITWLTIQNPDTTSTANVTITYMDQDANTAQVVTTIAPQTRYTTDINSVASMTPLDGISTTITSTNGVGIVAERIMYWTSGGVTNVGGHCTIGATGISNNWYFAEGSTLDTDDYDSWITVLNPSTTSTANLTITYIDNNGSTVQETPTVAAQTRYNSNINAVSGMDNKQGVSTKIEGSNSVGVIAERSIYWDSTSISDVGGHCTMGVATPAATWYFAEGSTNGYNSWITILNPNTTTTANVTITYMDENGATAEVLTTISPNNRYSTDINSVASMTGKDGISTTVACTNNVSIVAERSMYWDSPGITKVGGHCSRGALDTAIIDVYAGAQ